MPEEKEKPEEQPVNHGGIDVNTGEVCDVPTGALYRVQAFKHSTGKEDAEAQVAFVDDNEPVTHEAALALCKSFNEDTKGTDTWFGVVVHEEPKK